MYISIPPVRHLFLFRSMRANSIITYRRFEEFCIYISSIFRYVTIPVLLDHLPFSAAYNVSESSLKPPWTFLKVRAQGTLSSSPQSQKLHFNIILYLAPRWERHVQSILIVLSPPLPSTLIYTFANFIIRIYDITTAIKSL